jgi:RsiW-degrading membrane proteinase PrsW (M82 family)
VLPVPLYLAVVLWADRVEPEPPLLLAAMFVWGACVAFTLAYVLNTAGTLLVGEVHGASVAGVYLSSVSAPVIEELLKGAPLLALLIFKSVQLDGLLDGIVYASFVGLGFATSENALYYGQEADAGGLPKALELFIVRGVWNPFSHPLFTAATGIGVAVAAKQRGVARWAAPLLGLVVAIGLHSIWNTGIRAGWHPFTYFLLFIPLLVLVAVAVVAIRRRDCRVLADHLPAALGREARVVAELGSPAGRRALRAVARRRGGPAGRRLAAGYEWAGVQLAFLERRVCRGQVGAERAAPRGRELRARFLACEEELGRTGILEDGPAPAGVAGSALARGLTFWFAVTAERHLVVHATNIGRRPLPTRVVELRGPPWRRRGDAVALRETALLQPGETVRRTIPPAELARQERAGRLWLHAGGRRWRRIPAALVRHVTLGPPMR